MTKYIIKNCPCFNEGHYNLRLGGECLDLTQDENECCAGCTNCLLKRIVEKCVVAADDYMNSKDSDDVSFGMQDMATTILSMLEIEEWEG